MKINLRLTEPNSDKPMPAIENVKHLAKNPNTWMSNFNRQQCRQFNGTELEAQELIIEIEKDCEAARAIWELTT